MSEKIFFPAQNYTIYVIDEFKVILSKYIKIFTSFRSNFILFAGIEYAESALNIKRVM